MHLRYALMALLSEGEAHGYQLLKLFAQRIGPFWHPNIGQVYQLLHDLERRGLVERRDNEAGTRLRRIFRLTARGERALHTWLTRRPAWPPPLRDEIFVRLLAAERGGTSALLAQVERQEVEYRRYLALVREAAAAPRASLARQLTDEAAVAQAEAHLGWLSRCREKLDPRPCLGSGSEASVSRSVSRATALPRPAEPARQTGSGRLLGPMR